MDTDEARQLLTAERDRLTALLDDETAVVDEQQDDDQDAGNADDARKVVDRELQRSERRRVADELAEVEAAFERVKDGTYGVSDVSGEPIPDERLRAVPYARRTVDEQQLADNQRRAQDPNNPDLTR